jgi:3',5'-cyclic AMP phosphodiesterase CpdA
MVVTRIVVTSDLHYDSESRLTPPATIAALFEEIHAVGPDAVVLAGDVGHPLENFRGCLAGVRSLGVPVAVLAGNHDVWVDDEGIGSKELWEHRLADTTREAGAFWLEQDDVQVDDVAIVGSLAWYDYSAAPEHLRFPDEHFARIKRLLNNDGSRIDWPWSDVEFAARLRQSLVHRLAQLEQDAGVRAVVVATHVPVFEEQMTRKPGNEQWELSNAYFGNLTTGAAVARFPKVRAVVSGHTHCGRRGTVAREGAHPIEVHVVGSEYGEPAFVVVEC